MTDSYKMALFENKYKIVMIVGFIAISILIVEYILGPSIIGYNIYQKVKSSDYTLEDYGKNLKQLENNLLFLSANLSLCKENNNQLLSALNINEGKYSECKTKLGILEVNYNLTMEDYRRKLENLNIELERKNKEVETLKEEKNAAVKEIIDKEEEKISILKTQYELLAKNMAYNLCCKAKIDNPKIKFYKIENDRIVCLEEGTVAITC